MVVHKMSMSLQHRDIRAGELRDRQARARGTMRNRNGWMKKGSVQAEAVQVVNPGIVVGQVPCMPFTAWWQQGGNGRWCVRVWAQARYMVRPYVEAGRRGIPRESSPRIPARDILRHSRHTCSRRCRGCGKGTAARAPAAVRHNNSVWAMPQAALLASHVLKSTNFVAPRLPLRQRRRFCSAPAASPPCLRENAP